MLHIQASELFCKACAAGGGGFYKKMPRLRQLLAGIFYEIYPARKLEPYCLSVLVRTFTRIVKSALV